MHAFIQIATDDVDPEALCDNLREYSEIEGILCPAGVLNGGVFSFICCFASKQTTEPGLPSLFLTQRHLQSKEALQYQPEPYPVGQLKDLLKSIPYRPYRNT